VAARLLELPGPRGWLLWFILVADLVPAGPLFVAIAAPCGVLFTQQLGGDPRVWAIGFALLAIGVAVVQKYEALEKQQVFVCLVLLVCVVVSTLLVGPDWRRLFAGLFGLHGVPEVPPWAQTAFRGRPMALELATVFGYTGNIAMGYLVYSELVRHKRWGVFRSDTVPPPPALLPTDARNRAAARGGLRSMLSDLGVTASLIFVVTAAFLAAGAVVLHPIGQMPLGFNTVPEIYARVTHAFLSALLPARMASVRYESILRGLGLYLAVASVPLLWLRVQPQAMMDFVGFLSTNLGVTLTFGAALWLDRRLPPPLRVSPPVFVVGILSGLLVLAVTAVSAWFLLIH
jgi:hypothetical protein